MATEAGPAPADLTPLERDAAEYSLFAALRWLEQQHAGGPRLGESRRAADDPVRLRQIPHLEFAPSDVHELRVSGERRPVLEEFSFGVFGPNGALPLHLTEFAFERRKHFADATFSDFINLFQHRLISLFYRAWANSDPACSLDRPESDRFRTYLGSLSGLGSDAAWQRDSVNDYARLSRVGLLGPHARSAANLETLLGGYFGERVSIRQFVGAWLDIPPPTYCRLGRPDTATLGLNASLGASSWQCQHRFEIIVGPLDAAQFEQFLPGEAGLKQLRDLVLGYTNGEWSFQVRLLLRAGGVPKARLGQHSRLGWTSWVGGRRSTASDVVLSGEGGAAA
ncbi:MAG TPA: type VI secretion system baseplate subunit TssG [Steroidobacteraceae bacterium]|nr:type VI secretion system baseplate subunit TssG [Steroidobacteraceae bacterium]